MAKLCLILNVIPGIASVRDDSGSNKNTMTATYLILYSHSALSEEPLQIAVNRKEVKGKEEKERYTHLNVEFQRITRRDKKAFLSDQCKEIEENNRMGKTRFL